jgi:hypothetical protein
MKFGNVQIFCVRHFDETSRWMGWSKIEFSHSLALHPTATAVAVLRTMICRFIFLGCRESREIFPWLWVSFFRQAALRVRIKKINDWR